MRIYVDETYVSFYVKFCI